MMAGSPGVSGKILTPVSCLDIPINNPIKKAYTFPDITFILLGLARKLGQVEGADHMVFPDQTAHSGFQSVIINNKRFNDMNNKIQSIVERYGSDRTRLLDILWDVQDDYGYIPDEVLPDLGEGLNLSPLDVHETASFYHFFHARPAGKHKLYLSNTVIAKMRGFDAVHAALEAETGTQFGGTDESGTFGLFETNCIGLSDQEPAMMVDKVVFTNLTPHKVRDIIGKLKAGQSAEQIANPDGIARDQRAYVDALVESNIRSKGPVFFQDETDIQALLDSCLKRHPEELILAATASRLRGRGGAGFSAGLKWRLCREAAGDAKYIICNADEGEPGTFKDRVLLTHSPQEMFAGMIIAGHAVGALEGIVYLRYEYYYLKDYLLAQLQEMRDNNLLGSNILGLGMDFDIRIQMGAGAYICGDESALIESCEGKRGTPRLKPPFPVQQGFLGKPTAVNNVETFVAAARMLEKGSRWFESLGTADSTGTRLVSISGDCSSPGIYEVEWGTTLNHVLRMAGAVDAQATQISGPSGDCVSVRQDGERKLCYSDLSCNGSLMVFDHSRDLLSVVRDFMQFFVDESCGICTPCRAGNVDLLHKIDRIRAGKGQESDLDDLVNWGHMVQRTSRCGLGGTSPKPILTTLVKFPEIYRQKIKQHRGPLLPSFDHAAALAGYRIARDELLQEDVK
jgi:[NiFe] hydrogenase diaphorase moiety large subunit